MNNELVISRKGFVSDLVEKKCDPGTLLKLCQYIGCRPSDSEKLRRISSLIPKLQYYVYSDGFFDLASRSVASIARDFFVRKHPYYGIQIAPVYRTKWMERSIAILSDPIWHHVGYKEAGRVHFVGGYEEYLRWQGFSPGFIRRMTEILSKNPPDTWTEPQNFLVFQNGESYE